MLDGKRIPPIPLKIKVAIVNFSPEERRLKSVPHGNPMPVITVTGESSKKVFLERSSNLAKWEIIYITQPPDGSFVFEDTSPQKTMNFYRARY